MNIDRLRELFDLDTETGVLTWKVNKGPAKAGTVAGFDNGRGYLTVSVDRTLTRVHRIIFAMVHGYVPETVDHINGVPGDNRPSNLRAATHSENSYNRRISVKNTSGIKGVTWDSRKGKWRARCEANGQHYYLGRHDDLGSAAAAVRAFREQVHGEYARHE